MTRLHLAGYHLSADDYGTLGPEYAIRAWVMGGKRQAPLLAYPTARISLPITMGSGQKTIRLRAEKFASKFKNLSRLSGIQFCSNNHKSVR